MTYLTPIHFGERLSQAVIGSQMALTYVSVMVMPLIFGLIADAVGTDVFPYALMILFTLFIVAVVFLKTDIHKGRNALEV